MENENKKNIKNKKATTKKTSTKNTTSKKNTKKAAPKSTNAAKKGSPKKAVKPLVEKVETVKEEPKKVEKLNTSKVEEKKNETKTNKLKELMNSEIGSLILIVLVLAAVLLVFFGITSLIKGNDKKDEDTATVDIQYKEILVSNILNQSESSYYVLVLEKEDPYLTTYNTYLSLNDEIKYYVTNLGNAFNKNYVGEESNLDVSSVEDLKFTGTTLLVIEDGHVVDYYEGNEEIIDFIK